jgi:hypothetical protein
MTNSGHARLSILAALRCETPTAQIGKRFKLSSGHGTDERVFPRDTQIRTRDERPLPSVAIGSEEFYIKEL